MWKKDQAVFVAPGEAACNLINWVQGCQLQSLYGCWSTYTKNWYFMSAVHINSMILTRWLTAALTTTLIMITLLEKMFFPLMSSSFFASFTEFPDCQKALIFAKVTILPTLAAVSQSAQLAVELSGLLFDSPCCPFPHQHSPLGHLFLLE